MESLLGHLWSPLRRESGSPRGSARGPGQRRGRGVSLPAPPPAARPRREAAGPAAGAQDAVGPHKRFVFTTSFRSLSGLPATIKGQVCSQEKTRVGRGLHREKKCTSQRLFRQRVRLGSAPGDGARHPPPEPASGRAQRGWGRESRRCLRRGPFCLSPPSRGGLPPGCPPGRRSPSDARREGGRREPRRLRHIRVPLARPPRAPRSQPRLPPPSVVTGVGGSSPREPPHALSRACRRHTAPPAAPPPPPSDVPRLGGQILVSLCEGRRL